MSRCCSAGSPSGAISPSSKSSPWCPASAPPTPSPNNSENAAGIGAAEGRMSDIVAEIHAWNRGRELDRLRLKYAAMEASPFAFYRGTCHLFYRDWPLDTGLNDAPLVWICGDLHLENFG